MKKIIQALKENTLDVKILLSIILFATLTRIAIPSFLGHPPNFSAIDATALFCGAYFSRRSMACLVVLLSVWMGDILLSKIVMGQWNLFYSGFYWQYGCYFLITFIGAALKDKVSPLRLASACLTSSIVFFGISNFGVWCSGFLYPQTVDGLITCYVSAIPFFKNTLLSDLFFTGLLFGSFNLIKITLPYNEVKQN
jgi:hypothetical protein